MGSCDCILSGFGGSLVHYATRAGAIASTAGELIEKTMAATASVVGPVVAATGQAVAAAGQVAVAAPIKAVELAGDMAEAAVKLPMEVMDKAGDMAEAAVKVAAPVVKLPLEVFGKALMACLGAGAALVGLAAGGWIWICRADVHHTLCNVCVGVGKE